MTDLTPQAARRYRRAAAFLIHWRGDSGDVGIDGATAILREIEGDPEATAGFACALASLAWEMAAAPDPAAAIEYLRGFAVGCSSIEVPA